LGAVPRAEVRPHKYWSHRRARKVGRVLGAPPKPLPPAARRRHQRRPLVREVVLVQVLGRCVNAASRLSLESGSSGAPPPRKNSFSPASHSRRSCSGLRGVATRAGGDPGLSILRAFSAICSARSRSSAFASATSACLRKLATSSRSRATSEGSTAISDELSPAVLPGCGRWRHPTHRHQVEWKMGGSGRANRISAPRRRCGSEPVPHRGSAKSRT
jgi:hypothetical protein